jgi:hypothetical protein
VSDVTTVAVPAVDEIFMRTVTSLRDKVDKMNSDNRALAATGSPMAQARIDVIEVELVFKSVAIDASSGIAKLLVADKQSSSTLEIRLTTRVRVD